MSDRASPSDLLGGGDPLVIDPPPSTSPPAVPAIEIIDPNAPPPPPPITLEQPPPPPGTVPGSGTIAATVDTGANGVRIQPNGQPAANAGLGGTVVSGPGSVQFPDGTVAIVTDNTCAGDADAIRNVAPPGTSVTDGARTWGDVSTALARKPAGSVNALVMSGHGWPGGVQSTAGNIHVGNLNQDAIDMIQSRLAPGAPIILNGCQCGGAANGAQALATRTGHPVIGNTGATHSGNAGNGDWVRYDP